MRTRRLEYDRDFRGYLVEPLSDGREMRTGPLTKQELAQARAQVAAEEELDRMRRELADRAEKAQRPPASPTPYYDPGRPVRSIYDRAQDRLGLHSNSSAVDIARAWPGSLPRVGDHPELNER